MLSGAKNQPRLLEKKDFGQFEAGQAHKKEFKGSRAYSIGHMGARPPEEVRSDHGQAEND